MNKLSMMSNKLLIFDIDGTLCNINEPVNTTLANTLRNLLKKHQLVLASGKPFGHIAGIIRQLELTDCMVISENGGTISHNGTFPPKTYFKIDVSDTVQQIFSDIRKEYIKEFDQEIWFQPNDVNFTIFPMGRTNDIHKISSFAKKFEKNENINVYYHKDSIDFTPKNFDKGTAVEILLKEFNYSKDNVYIFGDGSNDVSMLVKTDNAFLVNSTLDFKPKKAFKTHEELESFLKSEFL